MGNPTIRTAKTAVADAGNGTLATIPGNVIAQAANTLPPARDGEQVQRTVDVETDHGQVRLPFRLNSYKHGRSRFWHWLAERADCVK